jgi:AraC-like DNA-binding protein
MEDKFTRMRFEKTFNVEAIITLFYMEFSKNFHYDGESHDFWEMVYIDKGEMICQADRKRFLLKSGEMAFHKPGEFHNLSGNGVAVPNVSIITFDCHSRAMKCFEGKIFKLDQEEKGLLSLLFGEGLSCYRLEDERDPLLQHMVKLSGAPTGASQAVKNLLEFFLIRLARHTDALAQRARRSYVIDGVDIPKSVKEIVDLLKASLGERLTVSDIAARLGRSESAVKQLFARHFKMGVMHYYNGLKIEEAKRLIREGKHRFSEISDLLAFESPQYFSKAFKHHTGKTPGQYRNSIVK